MQKIEKNYKTNPGVGRRRRWKILFAHKELRGFILFFHGNYKQANNNVINGYWVYDEDALLLQAIVSRKVSYNQNGQPYLFVYENAFPTIESALENACAKYAIQNGTNIKAIYFIQDKNSDRIDIGSRFQMSDGTVEDKYILSNGNYQQSIVIGLANGVNQVMNVPLQEVNGYINISSNTPIGALVLGKNVGDCFNYNGIEYTIKEIF